MTRTRTLMLLSVLLLAGCPTRSDDVKVEAPMSSTETDGSADAAPAAPAPAAPAAEPVVTLTIVSPGSIISTNGAVAITVEAVGGKVPAAIQIVEDGSVLTTLDAPAPYSYSWDTKNTPEGSHALVAEATVNGKLITSTPVTVIVDRTAPTTISTTPATGATNVVLRAPIAVTFSKPILASSFTSSGVSLQLAGTVVPTTATLSSDGTSATIAINDLTSFSLPATFSVALAPTITDLAGNALKTPTAGWSWSVPDWIKYAPLASTTVPALAIGPAFQPTVAYTRCLSTGATSCANDLFVAASDGQSWSNLGQLPNLTGPGALALDSQGHPVVAGIGTNTAGVVTNNVGPLGSFALPSVFVATWDGSAWDSSIPGLGIDTSYAFTTNPIVRLDPSGRPVVAWKDALTATEAGVGVARWTGTQWDKSFGKIGSNVNSHSLILDGGGNPIVGWSAGGGSLSDLIPTAGFRAWNGLSWTSGGGFVSNAPFVALDRALEPIMLDGWTVEHYSSGLWLPAISTAVPASSASVCSHLTTGSDEQPVVAWVDTAAPAKVGLARWTGTEWNARAGLFNASGVVVTTESPEVVVDARGSTWISWREGSSVNVWMSNY